MPTDWGGGAGQGIASTLQELGRIRATQTQQQGHIWGSALDRLGRTIEQAPLRQLQQQELQARTLGLQEQAETRKLQLASQQREQAGSQALAKAISDPANEGDPQRIYAAVAAVAPDHAAKYLELATKNQEALQKLREAKATEQQSVANMFDGADPTDTAGLQARFGLLHSQRVDVAAYAQLFDRIGPEAAIKQIVDSAPENVKAARTRKEKAAEEAARAAARPTPTREVKTTNPDGSETIQIVEDAPGQTFTSSRRPMTDVKPGSFESFVVTKYGPMPTADQMLTARRAWDEATRKPDTGPAGPKPRNVTSGDAGRIADINSALGEAKALREELAGVKGATGTKAAVEAALPNWVTNATGIGLEAKAKQAIINRVKQIIGKGLEGGVLRKEDEEKYKQILPVIGDAPEIVAAKLTGLDDALGRKLETHLSALEDANYDTSKYRARATAGNGDTVSPPDRVPVSAPGGFRVIGVRPVGAK